MMCTLEAHINQVLCCSNYEMKPTSVINGLKRIGKHSRYGSQEDAHEFLSFTVDALQKACLNGSTTWDASSQATTLIYQIFGGYLRSQVKCLNCKAVSDRHEPFLNIALDIETATSVTEALEQFLKPEQLGGENSYKCSKCENMVSASKGYTIHHSSKVLTISLKRFADFTGGKINKDVKYPEYLDLRAYMSQSMGEPLIYSLYAVLVHSGFNCNAGHYICFIKAGNGFWYRMNDAIVPRRSVRAANLSLRRPNKLQAKKTPPSTTNLGRVPPPEETKKRPGGSVYCRTSEKPKPFGEEELINNGIAPPCQILFPPEKICMDWQRPLNVGVGLQNLGNMHYLNATLQCLTYTPPLANYMLSLEHSKSWTVVPGLCVSTGQKQCRVLEDTVPLATSFKGKPWFYVSSLIFGVRAWFDSEAYAECRRCVMGCSVHVLEPQNSEFLQTMAVNTGLELNHLKILDNFQLWNTYDTLHCEGIHNFTLPVWATKDVIHKMEKLAELSLLSLFGIYKTEEKSRLQGGVLVNIILNSIKQAANSSKQRKMEVYSAHDTTVGALQIALNIFNGKLPPYAACQFFELYQESSGRYSIEMHYRNDSSKTPYLLTLPGCTSSCPLEKFAELVSPVITENWSKECGKKDKMKDIFIGFDVAVGLLFIFDLVLLYLLYHYGRCRRRNNYQDI